MSKDIDAIAAATAETTTTAAIATARFYCGVATGTPNVSVDGWISGNSLLGYAPAIPRRNTASTSVTVTDADIGGMIICTGASTFTVTIPSTLTKIGSVIIRKGGTGNVVIAGGGGVAMIFDSGRTTITRTNGGATATWDGGLNNYWVTGCDA